MIVSVLIATALILVVLTLYGTALSILNRRSHPKIAAKILGELKEAAAPSSTPADAQARQKAKLDQLAGELRQDEIRWKRFLQRFFGHKDADKN